MFWRNKISQEHAADLKWNGTHSFQTATNEWANDQICHSFHLSLLKIGSHGGD